jgi:hypothetical protein
MRISRSTLVRLLLTAAAVGSHSVHAADFVVTRYDDPSPTGCAVADCSLREAVQDANDTPGPDRVLLSAGSYELTRFGADDDGNLGDLDLYDELEILGPGATMTEITAQPLGTASEEPVLSVFGTAALHGLTITRSQVEGIDVVAGHLTLVECEVTNNDFQGNSAGVRVAAQGTAVIRDSALVNNGMGLHAVVGFVTMENVTLHSNRQNQIFLQNGSDLVCTHCTVVEQVGGDPEVRVGDSLAEFASSIVSGVCELDPEGVITSSSGNVESPGHTCAFTDAGDRDDVANPGLSTLGDHGGSTRTFDLSPHSPALGLVEADECALRDQRGVARSFHFQTPCDSGAVERVTHGVRTPIFADGFLQGDAEAWSEVAGD